MATRSPYDSDNPGWPELKSIIKDSGKDWIYNPFIRNQEKESNNIQDQYNWTTLNVSFYPIHKLETILTTIPNWPVINTSFPISSWPGISNSTILANEERSLPDFNDPFTVIEAFALGLMILLTIGGNLLVIVAVLPSPTLRTPTHSLIVNLAVADLLLGVTVLPLSAIRELAGGAWLLGPSLCSVWTVLDVLWCTASILSLCGISVDRYIGVSRPLAYSRIITKRRARCLIAGIWTLAIAISIGPPLGWKEAESENTTDIDHEECHVNKELGYVIFSACGSFYLPALVVIALYFLVYRAAARHQQLLSAGSRVSRRGDVTLRVHLGSGQVVTAPGGGGPRRSCSATRSSSTTGSRRSSSVDVHNIRKLSPTGSNLVLMQETNGNSGVQSTANGNLLEPVHLKRKQRLRSSTSAGAGDQDEWNVPLGPGTNIRQQSIQSGYREDFSIPVQHRTCSGKNLRQQRMQALSSEGSKDTSEDWEIAIPTQQRTGSESWNNSCQHPPGRRLTAAGVYGRAAKFRRQRKAAKTLGIVVGGFLLCWFPFFLLLPIDAACETCELQAPFNFAFWLGYFNSCINPFIYACSSRELRRAFRSILCRGRRLRRSRAGPTGSTRVRLSVTTSASVRSSCANSEAQQQRPQQQVSPGARKTPSPR